MGKEQRSRRRLEPGTMCYLCSCPIDAKAEKWNRDHVPPERFYARALKDQFRNLHWLPTHVICNSDYRLDEAYFTTAFAGHAKSSMGRAVFEDFRRARAKGHDIGLLKTILSQFGKEALPDGRITFAYDHARVSRIVWKLVRGIHFMTCDRLLPVERSAVIAILLPDDFRTAHESYAWWPAVRDTDALGVHPEVLDYKWIGLFGEGLRGHALAILLWRSVAFLVMFHDPSCGCSNCIRPEGWGA
jgi:hypothetical protein